MGGKIAYLLLFLTVLFLSIPSSFALDFENGTITTVSTDSIITSQTVMDKLRVQQFNVDDSGKWFVSFSESSSGGFGFGYLARYSDDLGTREYGWSDLENDGNENTTFDFQVGFPTDNDVYVKWINSYGSANRYEANTIYYVNLTQRSENITDGTDWGSSLGLHSYVSNNWNYILFQTNPTRFLSSSQLNSNPDNISYMTNESVISSSLYWPSESTSPENLDIAYSSRWNSYIVVYESVENIVREIYANYYGSSLNYLGRELLATNSTNDLFYPQIMNIGTDWYLSYYTNDTGHTVTIDILELITNNDFESVDTITFIPANINGSLNETIVPTLVYNGDNDLLSLFYMVQNATGNDIFGLYSLEQNYTCTCSAWVNTSCVGSYRKQTRDCNYDICGETQYIEDLDCDVDTEAGQYFRTVVEDVDSCETGWAEIGQQVECKMTGTLPDTCFNITTFATTKIEFQNPQPCLLYGFVPIGNFEFWACTPYSTCQLSTLGCYNYTQFAYVDKNYTGYNGGDTFSGRVIGRVGSDCSCKEKFRITGFLSYQCTEQCEEQLICKDTNTLATLTDTCEYINETLCDYGCTGNACIADEDVTDEQGGYYYGQKAQGMFDWLFGFAFNEPLRIFVWLIITGVIMLVTAVGLGDMEEGWKISLSMGVVFIGLGLGIGMLPAWLGFLVGLPLIFILAQKFWKGG